MDDYERVLLVKQDVQIYKIPPRTSNRAYRASEWNLDAPDWNCRLRLIAKGNDCFIKLDEKSTGQFFGQCPIDKYPGPAVEPVSDSSRYFVLKLVNEQTNRTAFVGIGFVDRSDSFDLNVALQDHFKIVQMENDTSGKEAENNAPKLDLGFKEGQTIKVNLNIGKKAGTAKPRPKGNPSGILLPPPPGGKTAGQPPAVSAPLVLPNNSKASPTNTTSTSSSTSSSEQHSSSNFHQQLLDGLESLSMTDSKSVPIPKTTGMPILTPANSVCAGDDFALFTAPPTSTNVISSTLTSNGNENNKADDDFWSDFESFRNNEGSSNSASTGNANSAAAATFDDWAKF